MSFPVVKAAGYVLVHTPDMVIHNGTTQVTERIVNPSSEYLIKIKDHLRKFDEVVSYAPNQTYIGNMNPSELKELGMPWYTEEKAVKQATRFGKFGEIMPQDEFIGLLQICDAFDLVMLDKKFASDVKQKLQSHPLVTEQMVSLFKEGFEINEIKDQIENHHAEALYNNFEIVGCIKRAHDVDTNLTSHIMFENLVVKASGVLSILNLIQKNNINPLDIEYVIECSEEACGDMNQRGGGNFAKSLAEIVGLNNATGSDMRGFCAGPTHSLISASALVKSGIYKNVIVAAGGATAKLGMNGKDHVKKDLPILEDCVGGFAVLVSENDGISPVLRTDIVGRHTVGTGSSPQAVITSLVSEPLEKVNLKITDIDKYSVEMQNPDITKPAGAGDVPEANYKMIAALAVKRGDIERKELANFVSEHGMMGWAPTQGHIPSGVPYIGFAIEDLTLGSIQRSMIVGKGSLFLGRMTNLFDGVSIVLERNSGEKDNQNNISKEEVKSMIGEAMKEFAAHLISK